MSVKAIRYDDGSAMIVQGRMFSPAVSIDLTPDQVTTVALALLGGATDEMVKEIGARGWDVNPHDAGPYRDAIYDMVRMVLTLLGEPE
jgi:hypothetical protein